MNDTQETTAEQLDKETEDKFILITFTLKKQFRKKPDLNGILFLIGMQELGLLREFSKEEKLDLMHIATCKLLSYSGYYSFTGRDADGWPQYELQKKLPAFDLLSQEVFLKKHIVRYFEEENLPMTP